MMKRKKLVVVTTTTSAGDEMAAWRHIPSFSVFILFFLLKNEMPKTCKLAFRDSAHL